MTRIKLSDFKAILSVDGGLYHALLEPGVSKAEPGGEVVAIDDAAIKGEAFKLAWTKFVQRRPEVILSTEQPTDELYQEQQKQAKLEADKAYIQKHADEAAARYFQYWVPKGLVDNQQNRSQIFAEMEKRETRNGNIPSAALLDVVIPFLSRQGLLQFKQPPAESLVVVPPPPPPVLIDDPESPTGKSEQLSLSEQPRSRHTKAQLRDWDARRRAEQQRQVIEANRAVAQAFRETAASEITL